MVNLDEIKLRWQSAKTMIEAGDTWARGFARYGAEDVPALVAEVERLRAENEEMRTAILELQSEPSQ